MCPHNASAQCAPGESLSLVFQVFGIANVYKGGRNERVPCLCWEATVSRDKRLHSALGYRLPREFERSLLLASRRATGAAARIRGMLWFERVDDHRSCAILTKKFSLKTSESGEREKT
jgi:hypothetical protein